MFLVAGGNPWPVPLNENPDLCDHYILMYLESVLYAWGNKKGLMALKTKVVKKAVEYFWEGHAVSLWS